jgi:ElaB/YqjD/DUF883 family membrane-anchored ribosome-binding protein
MAQEFGSIAGDLAEGASKFRTGFEEAVTKGKDAVGKARDVAQDKLRRAGESASDFYHQGVEKTKALENDLESFVKERPLLSILIAAGCGMLCGAYIIRRR